MARTCHDRDLVIRKLLAYDCGKALYRCFLKAFADVEYDGIPVGIGSCFFRDFTH